MLDRNLRRQWAVIVAPALLVAAPAWAQDAASVGEDSGDEAGLTAEQALAEAGRAYGPPAPDQKCEDKGSIDSQIVVCGKREDNSQYRVQPSSQLDPESEQALKDPIPHAPDFAESCKNNPEKGPCVKFGKVPPPAYMIDFSKLPDPPPGSDADKIAKGEMDAP